VALVVLHSLSRQIFGEDYRPCDVCLVCPLPKAAPEELHAPVTALREGICLAAQAARG
jgi:hypothetical protein